MTNSQREKGCPADTGTDRAILCKSGARPSPTRSGWGGARNDRNRVSDRIKLSAALDLIEAARRAIDLGLPFNRHVTIHWGKGGVADCDAAGATGAFIKLLSDWVRKRGGNVAYAWVREVSGSNGTHVHILLHVTRGIQLRRTRTWLKRIVQNAPAQMVVTKAIGGDLRSADGWQEWYVSNLAYVTAYVLKGVGRDTAEALALDRAEEGGRIIGKRTAVSQNLLAGGRGRSDLEHSESVNRSKSAAQTLTQDFSHARARARQEPENENFADDLAKSKEAA